MGVPFGQASAAQGPGPLGFPQRHSYEPGAAGTPVVSTLALGIGLAIIIIGLLILRFIVKTAFTVAKIAILVAVGVATYFGLEQLFG